MRAFDHSTTRARPILRFGRVILCLLTLLSIVTVSVEAGAGRTRPGGGQSGGGSPQRAAGRASYGHGHGGHHGHYGHHGYGYYGHYGYHGYPGWGWGWGWAGWYGGGPYYVVREVLADPDSPGAVETDVRPKKASVIVDGAVLGQARDYNGRWELLWLEPGAHVLEFGRDGYMTLRRHLEVRAGMHVRIVEELQKGEGIDPRSSTGPPPTRNAQSTSSAERTTELRTEIESIPPSRGALERGMLRVSVEPADAAVYLDGEFLARAGELNRLHGALPVAQGVHTVEVVRPGYESRAVEIDVTGEKVERLEITLRRSD